MLLTDILGDDVPAAIAALRAKYGCVPPTAGADDEADMRHALSWLLTMAEITHRRSLAPPPPVDEALVAELEARLANRPPRDAEHAQLHIDPASSVRRASVAAAHLARSPGPTLAVGDDDAVTLALALMGVTDLFAIDVDPRILAFLSDASGGAIRTAEVDVLSGALPSELRRRCAAVLTDPIRDMDATIGFLLFGAAALDRDKPSRMYWADHPAWSFEHREVVAALAGAGIHVAEVHEDLHAYPLEPGVIDLERVSRELGVELPWLRALAAASCAWSHLYALERRP